jgi:energy-converting hydrogenase A subunit R
MSKDHLDRRFIAFDLEGPLSPDDNAYDLMGLFPNGKKIFEALSLYDDQLALEGKEGYEAGDTLRLILPFLIKHDISRKHIEELAEKARLNQGANELIRDLKNAGWQVFSITTAYEPYALVLTAKLGIKKDNVAATPFPPLNIKLNKSEERLIEEIENMILEGQKDLKKALDRFFWQEIPKTDLAPVMKTTLPIGGTRKVKALENFSRIHQPKLACWVFVGDSITDAKVLERLRSANGLAIAFNANIHALSFATIALASTETKDLWPILDGWQEGGLDLMREKVLELERLAPEKYSWLQGKRLDDVLEVHRQVRLKMRQEAGKLG